MSETRIRLYNTLTRQVDDLQPINDGSVGMYVCGPTVYDHAHIGNARPVIVFDVLFRLLRHVYGEDNVTYVRNITDVDDKIIDRARRDFPDMPLNEAIREVTEKTTAQFQADMKALGCLEPTREPRATEHIDGMIAMIQGLIAKGHAYVSKGKQGREVLFRVASMESYGALSRRNLKDQQAGARVAVEDHKENPADFVLWKESDETEPGWDAEFEGEAIHGRPGWHIECSAMSKAFLGETFDIHGGGLDLIFPHHENEIAQSCCAHGTDKMANIWMHNGFLQVEGRKMSKSEGNFITVHDLLHTENVGGRKWPGEVIRLAMLMTHYREPLDFTVRRLEEAEENLEKWRRAALGGRTQHKSNTALMECLAKDLNFAPITAELHRLAKLASGGGQEAANGLYQALCDLGLETYRVRDAGYRNVVESVLDPTIQERINQRLAFIAEKNWAEADRIRDELAEQGIQLMDSKDPETGERVTKWEVKR